MAMKSFLKDFFPHFQLIISVFSGGVVSHYKTHEIVGCSLFSLKVQYCKRQIQLNSNNLSSIEGRKFVMNIVANF